METAGFMVPMLRMAEVVLQPLQPGHAQALAAAAAEARDSFGHTHVPDGVEAARAWVDKALAQQAQGQRCPLAVLFRGRVAGSTSFYEPECWNWPPGSPLARRDGFDAVKIGYTWLASSAQRSACNTTAKLLMLAQAFEAWRVHRVAFCTDQRNLRSRAAIERLGARFEGVLRAHMPAVDGGLRDTAMFSITAGEWPAVRERLRQRLAAAAA